MNDHLNETPYGDPIVENDTPYWENREPETFVTKKIALLQEIDKLINEKVVFYVKNYRLQIDSPQLGISQLKTQALTMLDSLIDELRDSYGGLPTEVNNFERDLRYRINKFDKEVTDKTTIQLFKIDIEKQEKSLLDIKPKDVELNTDAKRSTLDQIIDEYERCKTANLEYLTDAFGSDQSKWPTEIAEILKDFEESKARLISSLND